MSEKKITSQLFWYSFANYSAIFIGYLSVILVFSDNLEFLGKVRFIETIGFLIHPFLLFGLSQSLVNFAPVLEKYHIKTFFGNSILFIATLSVIAFGILLLVSYNTNPEKLTYYFLGLLIAISLAYIELIKSQAIIIKKPLIPVFLEKILPRIFLPIIFILLLQNIIDEEVSLQLFGLSYSIVVLLMLGYVLQFIRPRFSTKREYLFENFSRTEFFRFSSLAFVGSLGTLLAFRIDSFMIPMFLTMEDNGVYSIAILITSLIAVPSTAVFALNAPKISGYLKNNEINKLAIDYKESAKLLFFIGALFFSCFLVSMTDFLEIIFPNNIDKLDSILPVVFLLGISAVVNMGTGFNNEIIMYSKYFRFNIVTILVLVVLNISLNYYFLEFTTLGLMGVAIASTASISVFNLVKLLFIYQKFGIVPFDKKYLFVVLIVASVAAIAYLLPNDILGSDGLTILYKTLIVLVINGFLVYRFSLINYSLKTQ